MIKLHPAHLVDLQRSGLSDEIIEKSGIYTVLPEQINKIMGWDAPVSSLLAFPYPGTDFTRYKLFPPLERKDGHKQKYHQSKGSDRHLYMPPGFNPECDNISMTEGEKKGIKATQEGLNCLGLGGIWNFAAKDDSGKPELIDDFNLVDWQNKKVILVPDADFQTKPEVRHAVYRLGMMLKARGADITIVCFPEGQKLDDYLCEHDIEEFNKLPRINLRHKIFEDARLKDTRYFLSELISEATPENYKPLVGEIVKIDDIIQRELLCKSLAKQVGVSLSTVQQAIKPLRENEQNTRKFMLEDTEPWEEPVNGGEILDTIYSVIQKHVVLEPPAIVAVALWIIETYCYDSFDILPILGITSPEKRCGKSTSLELLGGLVDKPLLASNISTSSVYRIIEKNRPCLLIDEADTFLKDNEELRGIINSGHTRKAAFVIRCNPNTFEPERFSTWAPKAISLIGKLPDTLSDRSIPIKMKRKLTSEKVKRMTQAFDKEYRNLRRRIKRWEIDNAEALKNLTPVIPETGNDRAADNWLPLLNIAGLAGGDWPDRAREAMLAIESVSNEETTKQILLRDIKEIFDGRDKISSAELVEKLISIEEHPWGDWKRGKPITQNSLAKLLKPFEIFPKEIRLGDKVPRGYEIGQFTDAFRRYLPSPAFQGATVLQPTPVKELREIQSATQTEDVALTKQRKPASFNDCSTVAVQKGGGDARDKFINPKNNISHSGRRFIKITSSQKVGGNDVHDVRDVQSQQKQEVTTDMNLDIKKNDVQMMSTPKLLKTQDLDMMGTKDMKNPPFLGRKESIVPEGGKPSSVEEEIKKVCCRLNRPRGFKGFYLWDYARKQGYKPGIILSTLLEIEKGLKEDAFKGKDTWARAIHIMKALSRDKSRDNMKGRDDTRNNVPSANAGLAPVGDNGDEGDKFINPKNNIIDLTSVSFEEGGEKCSTKLQRQFDF